MNDTLITNSFLNEINNELCPKNQSFKIHVRAQQRTTRKYITIVEGVPTDCSLKKILKVMKKKFVCNGTILKNDAKEQIINLSGDQRHKVKEFLVKYNIASDNDIILHGF